MLNYIGAELYKLRHKKSLFIGMGILLLLESTLLLPGFWRTLDEDQLGILLSFLAVLQPIGLFLAPIFASYAFDDQHGHGTLKNEIVYGISRSQVYLGKLLTAFVVGTAASAVVIGWYLVIAALLARNFLAVDRELWVYLVTVTLSAWTTWLSAASATILLLFLCKTSGGALVFIYLLTLFGLPACMVGYGVGAPPPERFDFFYWFTRLFYAAPYQIVYVTPFQAGNVIPQMIRALLKAAVLCLGWVGGTTAIGIGIFSRQEVK